jgi:transcriptional regulator with XRE-family HTH domain
VNEFGRRLKLLREQKDLPLSKLAEDIDTTKSALSRYENGKMEPGLKVMIKIAEYFDVSLDWLAGNGDDEDYIKVSFGPKDGQLKRTAAYTEKIAEMCMKQNISPEKLEQLVKMIEIINK